MCAYVCAHVVIPTACSSIFPHYISAEEKKKEQQWGKASVGARKKSNGRGRFSVGKGSRNKWPKRGRETTLEKI